MAVFRVERNTGYTVMSNHHLRNKELSLNLAKIRRHVPGGDELHFLLNQCPFFLCYIEFDLYFSFASVHAIAPFHSGGLGHFPTSNFQPTHRRAGERKYGKGYSFPMLATKLYPLLPTTPGTANLTNFPKRKTPQSATFQSLCINKNERTLFPRFVVVGFLYSFCSSRQDFQIFFAHTVKHGIELTAACGFLLFPFREKELVY